MAVAFNNNNNNNNNNNSNNNNNNNNNICSSSCSPYDDDFPHNSNSSNTTNTNSSDQFELFISNNILLQQTPEHSSSNLFNNNNNNNNNNINNNNNNNINNNNNNSNNNNNNNNNSLHSKYNATQCNRKVRNQRVSNTNENIQNRTNRSLKGPRSNLANRVSNKKLAQQSKKKYTSFKNPSLYTKDIPISEDDSMAMGDEGGTEKDPGFEDCEDLNVFINKKKRKDRKVGQPGQPLTEVNINQRSNYPQRQPIPVYSTPNRHQRVRAATTINNNNSNNNNNNNNNNNRTRRNSSSQRRELIPGDVSTQDTTTPGPNTTSESSDDAKSENTENPININSINIATNPSNNHTPTKNNSNNNTELQHSIITTPPMQSVNTIRMVSKGAHTIQYSSDSDHITNLLQETPVTVPIAQPAFTKRITESSDQSALTDHTSSEESDNKNSSSTAKIHTSINVLPICQILTPPEPASNKSYIPPPSSQVPFFIRDHVARETTKKNSVTSQDDLYVRTEGESSSKSEFNNINNNSSNSNNNNSNNSNNNIAVSKRSKSISDLYMKVIDSNNDNLHNNNNKSINISKFLTSCSITAQNDNNNNNYSNNNPGDNDLTLAMPKINSSTSMCNNGSNNDDDGDNSLIFNPAWPPPPPTPRKTAKLMQRMSYLNLFEDSPNLTYIRRINSPLKEENACDNKLAERKIVHENEDLNTSLGVDYKQMRRTRSHYGKRNDDDDEKVQRTLSTDDTSSNKINENKSMRSAINKTSMLLLDDPIVKMEDTQGPSYPTLNNFTLVPDASQLDPGNLQEPGVSNSYIRDLQKIIEENEIQIDTINIESHERQDHIELYQKISTGNPATTNYEACKGKQYKILYTIPSAAAAAQYDDNNNNNNNNDNNSSNNSNKSRNSDAFRLRSISTIHKIKVNLWSHLDKVKKSGILNTLSKTELMQREAIYEVYTSELSYNKSLFLVINLFMNNSKLNPNLPDTDRILSKQEHTFLFSNLQQVYDMSNILISELQLKESISSAWSLNDSIICDLCEVMNKFILPTSRYSRTKKFDCFIKYCQNQHFQYKKFEELKCNNQQFVQTVSELERSKQCEGLDLMSFLLLPVQRVTRYPLLFSNIIDYTPELHKDCKYIQDCFLQLQNMATLSNREADKYLMLQQLNDIQNSLYFNPSVRTIPIVAKKRTIERRGDLWLVIWNLRMFRNPEIRLHRIHLIVLTDIIIITKLAKRQKTGKDKCTVVDYCKRKLSSFTEIDPATQKFNKPTTSNFHQMAKWAITSKQWENAFLLNFLANHTNESSCYLFLANDKTERVRWTQILAPSNSSFENSTMNTERMQMQAISNYRPSVPDELPLECGDCIIVIKKLSDGWYEGERIRDGRRGWFPSNHAIEIGSEAVRSKNSRKADQLRRLSVSVVLDDS